MELSAMLATRLTLRLLTFTVLTYGLHAQPVATGGIAGVVRTEDGKAVSARVRATRTAPLPPLVSTVIAAPGGAFQLSGLLPGTYEICVNSASGLYVDACLWDGGPAVTVTASNAGPLTL